MWTGNVARQPMMKGVEFRSPADGLPNADRVMEHGVLLPCAHGLSDDDIDYVVAQIADLLESSRLEA